MAYRQAKYCLDLNHIRWTLLEGMITRKNPQDGPTEGQELPIQQVTGVEKTTVKRVYRSRLGWPITLLAVALLALSAWMASVWGLAAIPGFAVGLVGLVWGAKRIASRTEILDAYRIVAPIAHPEDWVVVGSISEIQGFMEGVKIELQEKEGRAQQPVQN